MSTRTEAMTQFGNALRKVREAKKIRLHEISAHIDVSIPFLSDVENGRRPLSDERIREICTFLAVDPMPLLELASRYRGKITLDITGCTSQQIRAALLFAEAWPSRIEQ